jgi:hypothetical protein
VPNQFFRAKRVPAVIFGVFFIIFALFLTVTLPTWLSVGRGDPATRTVVALANDQEFRYEAASFFVEKLSADAAVADLPKFAELETAINKSLDELVKNEEFMSKVKDISGELYDFFIDGAKEFKMIAAQDVVGDVVDALVEVDPRFAPLQEQVSTWKGLELEPMNDAPDFKSIKSSLAIVFWASLVLTLISGALYSRWARSRSGALLFIGIPLFILGLMNVIAASSVRSAVVSAVDTDSAIAAAAVPVVARSVLNPFRTVGIIWIALGVIAIVGAIVLTRRSRTTVTVASEVPTSTSA